MFIPVFIPVFFSCATSNRKTYCGAKKPEVHSIYTFELVLSNSRASDSSSSSATKFQIGNTCWMPLLTRFCIPIKWTETKRLARLNIITSSQNKTTRRYMRCAFYANNVNWRAKHSNTANFIDSNLNISITELRTELFNKLRPINSIVL